MMLIHEDLVVAASHRTSTLKIMQSSGNGKLWNQEWQSGRAFKASVLKSKASIPNANFCPVLFCYVHVRIKIQKQTEITTTTLYMYAFKSF